jgi:hypothetical protein
MDSFIGYCLNSIVHQTRGDFECIIVDDNSTDFTRPIIERCMKSGAPLFLILPMIQEFLVDHGFWNNPIVRDVFWYKAANTLHYYMSKYHTDYEQEMFVQYCGKLGWICDEICKASDMGTDVFNIYEKKHFQT